MLPATRAFLCACSLCMLPAACATTLDAQKAVAERASFDLGCPMAELDVVPLPGSSYGVRGCGKQAAYVFAEPACQSRGMMTRGDFASSCTPMLDDKGSIDQGATRPPQQAHHDAHSSAHGADHDAHGADHDAHGADHDPPAGERREAEKGLGHADAVNDPPDASKRPAGPAPTKPDGR